MDTQKLISIFNLSPKTYSNLKEYEDGKIGFSAFREYPAKIKGKLKFKHDDSNCIFWITAVQTEADIVKLEIRVNSFTFKSDNRRVLIKNKVFSPLEIKSIEEYQLDVNTGLNRISGKKINGNTILEELYQKHILPIRPLRGLIVRNHLFFLALLRLLVTKAINALTFSIKLTTGYQFIRNYEDELDAFYKQHVVQDLSYLSKDEIKPIEKENIKALNYHTTRRALISSAFTIVAFTLLINKLNLISKDFAGASVLWIAVVILIMWVFNSVFPIIHLWFINALLYLLKNHINVEIKV
jgi:hypothetical protein